MKRNAMGVNVGTSSILIVFVLLCLTTFAALSLVSANADYALAVKASEAATRYYEADAQAEDVLDALDLILRDSHAAAANEEEYRRLYATAAERLPQEILFEGSVASYSIDIGSSQRLDVVLALPYPAGEGYYTRLKWQTVPLELQGEEEEQGLNLFRPGETGGLPMF